MPTEVDKILAQVSELEKMCKDNDIISLLKEKVLKRLNNSTLYQSAGKAWANIRNFDKAIALYDQAIILDPTSATAYSKRARSYNDKGLKDKAWQDIQKAFELDNNNTIVFLCRGSILNSEMKYKEAIEDYSKAISIKPDNYIAYNNRGNTLNNLEKFDAALTDFNQAIAINSNYIYAYYNRGNAFLGLKMYNEALSDYNQTIEHIPDFVNAYNNRGITWANLGNKKKAIRDYKFAINKDPNYNYPYRNRAAILYNDGKYTEALKDFKKALEIDPNDKDSKYWVDLINAKEGNVIELPDKAADKNIYLFKSLLDGLPEERDIMKLAVEITEESIEKIQKYAFNHKVVKVAHYTRLKVADILISEANPHLIYCNAIYMNDPEEGEVLLNYLDGTIKKAYESGKQGEDSNIYLGSFLDAQEHKDELVMWRTYGKDELGTEAAGCSIIINTSFFDKHRHRLNSSLTSSISGSVKYSESDEKVINQSEQPLYRVLYYDKIKNVFTNHDQLGELQALVKDLEIRLTKLITMKENKNGNETDKDKAINKIVYHILSEIRYLFKSADYAFENEYRIIQYATNPDIIKVDALSTPKRLYIESNKEVLPHIDEIILGAKVIHPERWIYMDFIMKNNNKIPDKKKKLNKSMCKFQ